jgi:hypothetical protein
MRCVEICDHRLSWNVSISWFLAIHPRTMEVPILQLGLGLVLCLRHSMPPQSRLQALNAKGRSTVETLRCITRSALAWTARCQKTSASIVVSKPFIGDFELLNISLVPSTIRVLNEISTYCYNPSFRAHGVRWGCQDQRERHPLPILPHPQKVHRHGVQHHRLHLRQQLQQWVFRLAQWTRATCAIAPRGTKATPILRMDAMVIDMPHYHCTMLNNL